MAAGTIDDAAVREELEVHAGAGRGAARARTPRAPPARVVLRAPRRSGSARPPASSLTLSPLLAVLVRSPAAAAARADRRRSPCSRRASIHCRLRSSSRAPPASRPCSRSASCSPTGSRSRQFKHGAGPHTGVHLIYIRRDLGAIVHHHPPIARRRDLQRRRHLPGRRPVPRRRRRLSRSSRRRSRTSSSSRSVRVPGAYTPQPLPPLRPTQTVDGYRFALARTRRICARSRPGFLSFTVTAPTARPRTFTPWYGALAHAIFFRTGSLDYFHTHVCAPGASRLHERARRREGHRHVGDARQADGRRARAGRRHVAAVPPVPRRRPRADARRSHCSVR